MKNNKYFKKRTWENKQKKNINFNTLYDSERKKKTIIKYFVENSNSNILTYS